MKSIKLNLKLQRVLHKILSNKQIAQNNRIDLQDTLAKGLYEILEISFKLNASDSKVEKHIISEKIKNPIENTKFVAKTVENESTYFMLNNYFIYFLFELDKYNVDVEFYLEKEGIDEHDIKQALKDYNEYLDSIRHIKKQLA